MRTRALAAGNQPATLRRSALAAGCVGPTRVWACVRSFVRACRGRRGPGRCATRCLTGWTTCSRRWCSRCPCRASQGRPVRETARYTRSNRCLVKQGRPALGRAGTARYRRPGLKSGGADAQGCRVARLAAHGLPAGRPGAGGGVRRPTQSPGTGPRGPGRGTESGRRRGVRGAPQGRCGGPDARRYLMRMGHAGGVGTGAAAACVRACGVWVPVARRQRLGRPHTRRSAQRVPSHAVSHEERTHASSLSESIGL